MSSVFQLGEVSSSAAYRLAREVVIPRLRAEVFPLKGAEPFSLRDEIYAIMDDEVRNGRITRQQLEAGAKVMANGATATLAALTRYYALHLLKSWGEVMSTDVRGMFVLSDVAVEQEEEEEAEEEGHILSGSIYAYTFPSLKGSMIKVGKATGEVHERIKQQLGTANPEAPVVLKVWNDTNIGAMETAIHGILKARGKWVDAPRAKEWFRASVEEVDAIIHFVKNG